MYVCGVCVCVCVCVCVVCHTHRWALASILLCATWNFPKGCVWMMSIWIVITANSTASKASPTTASELHSGKSLSSSTGDEHSGWEGVKRGRHTERGDGERREVKRVRTYGKQSGRLAGGWKEMSHVPGLLGTQYLDEEVHSDYISVFRHTYHFT